MKKSFFSLCPLFTTLFFLQEASHAQLQVSEVGPLLHIQPSSGGVDLSASLPDSLRQAPGLTFKLQRSPDLVSWEEVLRGSTATFLSVDRSILHREPADAPRAFWRLVVGQQVMATASDGENIFGFAESLARQLEDHQNFTVEEFLQRYSTAEQSIQELGFDPGTAEYFDVFQSSPVQPRIEDWEGYDDWLASGLGVGGRISLPALKDLGLNAEERAVFDRQGMVASVRLGEDSFVDAFYHAFNRHLPVFVGADSVLHAWHMTYAEILKHFEQIILIDQFQAFLQGLHDGLPDLAEAMHPGELQACLHDADLYLTVALNLMEGRQAEDLLPSRLGSVDAMVRQVMKGVEAGSAGGLIFPESGKGLFGREKPEQVFVDFSQMKPRGHYTESETLKRYFRSAMWCGRIDLRVAGPKEWASSRELGTALVFNELMRRGQLQGVWTAMDEALRVFVGVSDSMTFKELDSVHVASELDLTQMDSLAPLEALQETLEAGELGLQQIVSHNLVPDPGMPLVLPRSFTVFGQKFVLDSWALSQLVYPRVFWQGEQLRKRRYPSALDVAFTVLGQSRAADWLALRIENPQGMPFRDGYPIAHQLSALHEVVDQLPDSAWHSSLYTQWLNALRQLSQLPKGPGVPQVFQTSAWADRVMHAQLGSWTQLRHDTILYAKQSVTPGTVCDLPYTYLEPVPDFWQAMASMSTMAADSLEALPAQGQARLEIWISDPNELMNVFGLSLEEARAVGVSDKLVSRKAFSEGAVRHLRHFAEVMKQLHAICQVQQAGQALSEEQRSWLKDMLEIMERWGSGGPPRSYSGWYPSLFYQGELSDFDGEHPSADWDPLVTDVHTVFPDDPSGDAGGILHEGIGKVAMMFLSIDCQDPETGQPMLRTYAGPIYTHYEFLRPSGERMTDEAWESEIGGGKVPPLPEWTEEFLLP